MNTKTIPWDEIVTGDKKELFDLGRDMLSSWANKTGEQTNAAWLAGEMTRHIGMEAEEAYAFGDEAVTEIDRFNASLDALDRACRQGMTKEAWLAEQLEDLPMENMEERGRYLMEMRDGLRAGNAAAYRTLETGEIVADIPLPEAEMDGGWTHAQVKDYAREIGQQASLSAAMGGAMDIARPDVPMGLPVPIEGVEDNVRGSAIDVGLKTVAVGVLKVAAEKGKLPGVLRSTPLPALVAIASSGMENFRIAGQLANGQISAPQAVERMGRVSCGMIGNLAGHLLASPLIARVPYVGPIVAFALTTSIGERIRATVSESVSAVAYQGYQMIQPVAVKVVETITEKSRAIFSGIKNFVRNTVTA